MLLIVMAINLRALLVKRLSKYLSVESLEVANRILGLLAALATEPIINGLRDIGIADFVKKSPKSFGFPFNGENLTLSVSFTIGIPVFWRDHFRP